MSVSTDLPLLATTDADYWQDPHGAIRAAREVSNVARSPWGGLVLLEHDDCLAALADPRFVNDYDALLTRNGVTDGPLWDWWQLAMLNSNPPHHTRLRSLVNRAFTPRGVVRAVEPTRRVTAEIVDRALDTGRIELVSELCEPLPIAVMCELIGVPHADHADFDRWITDLGLMFTAQMTAESRAIAERAMDGLSGAIGELVEQRRAGDLGDDLLGDLVGAEDDGDRLSREELVAMIVNLLFGALDTTRGALSMHVAYLVQRPDVLAAVRGSRPVTPQVVEELLRVEPPVNEIARMAAEDVELRGHTVAAGEMVALSVLGANRDPAVFPDPDRFEPARHQPGAGGAPILSFGRGIHHCIGSALARVELREALDVLLERAGSLELDRDALDGVAPRYVPFLSVRCMETVPLVLTR